MIDGPPLISFAVSVRSIMARFTILLIACTLIGCGPEQMLPAPTPPMTASMLPSVQALVAKQLGVESKQISPDSTFSALGADELDLVEITMEVEERYGITISDDALVAAANVRNADALCKHLTLQAFVAVAEASPKRSPAKATLAVEEGALREAQVGPYGDLSQLHNPSGLELVFVPSFEDITRIQEQRLGRTLTGTESDALRRDAAVIALTPENAERMRQQRSTRARNTAQ